MARTVTACMTALMLGAGAPALAIPLHFSGEIDVVTDDDGFSDFAGLGVGTPVSGFIDDESFGGALTTPLGTVNFGCCAAAGGIEVSNNVVLDAEGAATLNGIQGLIAFVAGDLLDIINIEGDVLDADGRIEVGLSLLYPGDAYDDEEPDNYPQDAEPLLTGFFFLQESGVDDEDSYSAIGLVDDLSRNGPVMPDPGEPGPGPDMPAPQPDDPAVIPLPGGALLLLSGLLGLAGLRGFRGSRAERRAAGLI